MKKIVDNYGHEIVPGAKVAFNYSGMVLLGVVVEVKLKKGDHKDYDDIPLVTITVKHKDKEGEQTSKVGNRHNLVVLNFEAMDIPKGEFAI